MKALYLLLSLFLTMNLAAMDGIDHLQVPDKQHQASSGVSTLAFYITALSKNQTGTGFHTIPTSAPVQQKHYDFVMSFIQENSAHKKRNKFKIKVEENIFFAPDKCTETSHSHIFKSDGETTVFIGNKLSAYGCFPAKTSDPVAIHPLIQPMTITFVLDYAKQ